MTVLTDFARALVAHVANDAKRSPHAVEVAYDTWQKDMNEKQAGLDAQRDAYITTYEAVRSENNIKHSMYVSDQFERKQKWRESGQVNLLDTFVSNNKYPPHTRTSSSPSSSMEVYTQFYLPN